ncbi:hydrogenase isoenzymes formation protein HypE [Clostridium tepidiprofundi DSM 19306]|uniref:Hydrogenase isoenzymes formation protein HypE n=1 Tax=Clostridium tepidiprofundi DSM 19306 TaxID=1121338 RepID=A0A151B6V2_9CLOT|nr:hydrogenase expression/formation protein HypE [Clostridium tepidiprofundi]KYH35629.1 hydrogenase isoenzymes formation protein HypE [Clostridium tepidiprofundi DSM 19306]
MEETISMSYGSGGKKTSHLIEDIIIPQFNNEVLCELADGALLNVSGRIGFSTDSFVIYPYFFPGGDIGKLSVCGTVNDVIMSGCVPKYLSLALIIEEGFSIDELRRIVNSIAETSKYAGVQIVTGDTKVVDKGHGGGIYINTSGIGEKIEGLNLSKERINKGDKVIITGNIGDHGVSVLAVRENLLDDDLIESDCAPLIELLPIVNKYKEHIKIMRDPTRGGVATTLNEFIENSELCIELEEDLLPIDSKVMAACDILGLDPLYSANEGKALLIVNNSVAEELVDDLKSIEMFKDASIIGEVNMNVPGKVVMKNFLGATKILYKLTSNILPRIC